MRKLLFVFLKILKRTRRLRLKLTGKTGVVVSHTDPGHPNWIETCGHTEGTMCWRWYRLKAGDKPVEPACRVVKINDWKQK